MATSLHRFTISITPSMEDALDRAKQEWFYRVTQNEMIRQLILRGLDALDAEKAAAQTSTPDQRPQPVLQEEVPL